jgi:outer membrane protein assembly factor BamB
MIALKMSDGSMVWEAEFPDRFDLHQEDGAGKWAPHYNLSGHQPPQYDGDSIYFTYAGLHRFDIATGKMIWAVPYDVTEGHLKRGNAQAIIKDEFILTSAKGTIRAIEKATGKVRWASQDFGAAVAEMIVKGNTIYGRMGGTFYDFGKRDWDLKKPLGVVAVNLGTGSTVWKYDGASDAITNMYLLDEQNTILIADANNVIGLDTTSEGKIKEAFKVKVDFKRKASAGRSAMKVARFGLGGIQGGLKGMKEDKKSEDVPVAIVKHPNGDVVIRGRQHVVAFNPKSHEIPWATQFEAPGMSGWQKYTMVAIYALNYLQATGVSSQTAYGSSQNDAANNTRQSMLNNFSIVMNKRYSATQASGKFMHMLTNVEEGGDKGPGLVGVNMETGETSYSLVLKDREPNYEVDEISRRLYNLKNKEIQAFSIQ